MKVKQNYLGLVLSGIMPLCFATTDVTQNEDAFVVPPVGSCYGGGIVFYVNPDPNAPAGQRGLIVALDNASDSSIWDNSYSFGNMGTNVNGGTSFYYFTGASNTHNILNTNNGGLGWPAAEAAQAYNNSHPPSKISGCDGAKCDWALPSRDELATLYYQSTNIPNFWTKNADCKGTPPLGVYWSSTQIPDCCDYIQVWEVDFHGPRVWADGIVFYIDASFEYGVRTVRAF